MIIKNIEKFKIKRVIFLNICIVFFMAYGAILYMTTGISYMIGMGALFTLVILDCYFFIVKGNKETLAKEEPEEEVYFNDN